MTASPHPAELIEQITAYQRAAIVGTAVESGVADALAGGTRSVAQVAATCCSDERGTLALLAGMVATGLAEREAGGFRLSPRGAYLASEHPQSVASIARKEWFFYRAWGELPRAVADGHARIASWRERLEREPEISLEFLRALDDLAALFSGGLPELVGPCTGRLLDVGGGAGSHAADLVAANPGLEATVLDLAAVEAVVRERHPGLDFLAGDLDAERFGCPLEESWDAVLLANVLHDHPADRCARYVAEAAALLRPGGSLIVYEWVVDADRAGPPEVALFTPMMLVENEGGFTWTEEEIAAWIRDTGLRPRPMRRGAGPIAAIRAERAD